LNALKDGSRTITIDVTIVAVIEERQVIVKACFIPACIAQRTLKLRRHNEYMV
jgi:hypothetical protein